MTRIAVIGTTGGIGRALVEIYTARTDINRVYAFSRNGQPHQSDKVVSGFLDLGAPDSIAAAADSIGDSGLDLVIAATGILHGETIQPEKSISQLNAEHLQTLFTVNSIGPALLMKYFLPLLNKESRSVFAALSARVGSIGDNRLGGWYGYRASKAALNMLIRTAAIETKRSNREAIVVGLHPGTVATSLSAPFLARVPEGSLFSPQHSAACLAKVIDTLKSADSGKCWAWDGSEVPP